MNYLKKTTTTSKLKNQFGKVYSYKIYIHTRSHRCLFFFNFENL